MGKRLNTPKTRLIRTVNLKRLVRRKEDCVATDRWKAAAAKTAKEKLAKIPAAETRSSPFLKLVKLRGLTGTGLAQPKSMGDPENIKSPGKRIVPMGSMCGIGFKVNLPALSAV